MGRAVARAFDEAGIGLAASVDILPANLGCNHYSRLNDVKEGADAVVDFSRPSLTEELCRFALDRRAALIIATTGQSEGQKRTIEEASAHIPVVFCSNMSFGVSLFASLAGQVAAAFPYADVEIVEAHRGGKEDAPSGTALMLANTIRDVRGGGRIVCGDRSGGRRAGDIGISSLRFGEGAGVHEVIFDTGFQRVALRHEAFGPELFARGTVNALRFIEGKEAGLYQVNDILDLKRNAPLKCT